MTPLAHEIYRQLVRHLRAHHTSITYAELAHAVAKRQPAHHRSPAFHAALGDITVACRAQGLPLLPAIIWRSSGNRPATGYYAVAHPRAKTDDARVAAWKREYANVLASADAYPAVL